MSDPTRKDDKESASEPTAEVAGERHRDDERKSHGPVYKGGDWAKADTEHERESMNLTGEEEVEDDVERAKEDIQDPGTRGAVFGKGGDGIVERDHDDEPTARKN